MKNSARLFRGAILIVVPLWFAAEGHAQDENIYLVKMFDCAHQPTQRAQTGFRVRGLKGIVTALHGVAGCDRITVRSRSGLVLDQPLEVNKVDIDRDLALLSSPQLERVEGGLEPATTVVWESVGTVKVRGHPYNILSVRESMLSLCNPPLRPLKDIVPPDLLSDLIKRRSPNHKIDVLDLDGHLLPGHSGAPILDSENRVLAVANGGLKEGFAAMSWAVPFQYIDWEDAAGNVRLKELDKLSPNILFYEPQKDSRAAETDADFCTGISKLTAVSREGFYPIAGESFSERSSSRLNRSKPVLPGAISGVIQPQVYAKYNLYIASPFYEPYPLGKIEEQYYYFYTKLSNCVPDWERKEEIPQNPMDTDKRRYLFRKKAGEPTVEISYLMKVTPSGYHDLSLIVYPPGKDSWDSKSTK